MLNFAEKTKSPLLKVVTLFPSFLDLALGSPSFQRRDLPLLLTRPNRNPRRGSFLGLIPSSASVIRVLKALKEINIDIKFILISNF